MSRLRILPIGVFAVIPVAFLYAQFGGGMMSGRKTNYLSEFDKDHDGVLNKAERAAAFSSLVGRANNRRGFGRGQDWGTPAPGLKLTPAGVRNYGNEPLYDTAILRTIFLDFEDVKWEQEMEAFYRTDIDIPAKMTVDGKVYNEVGVHFRGQSSYSSVPTGWKRSMGISMNYAGSDQRLCGYKSLDVLNAAGDPTFLRTVLYMQIARQYIPAPKANFVRIVINGENRGIYANSQDFNADFTQEFFASKKGARWKVPGSPGARGGLAYKGDIVDYYKGIYEIKSKDDTKSWADLIHLTKVLTETPTDKLEKALEGLLDVDGALKFLALDKTLINNDGFWVRMSDYSIYEDDKGIFHVIPHDANETFREPESGFGGGGGGAGQGMSLDPFAGASDTRKALLNKLLAVPALRARYLSYMRDIAGKWLDWSKMEPIVRQYQALIAADVKADTHKIYKTEEFTSTITQDNHDTWGGPIAAPEISLKSFFEQRREFVLNYQEIKKLPAASK